MGGKLLQLDFSKIYGKNVENAKTIHDHHAHLNHVMHHFTQSLSPNWKLNKMLFRANRMDTTNMAHQTNHLSTQGNIDREALLEHLVQKVQVTNKKINNNRSIMR